MRFISRSQSPVVAADPRWGLVTKYNYRLDDPDFDYRELVELSSKYVQLSQSVALCKQQCLALPGNAELEEAYKLLSSQLHALETPDWRIDRVEQMLRRLPHSERFFKDACFWPRLKNALKDPGVNRMFQEEVADGVHSEFLAASYALMPSAITLEVPFQRCLNLKLEMADIPPGDPYHRISLVEEGFQYTRIRTATTAKYLQNMIKQGRLKNLLVLNCGMLPEFRYFPELKAAIMQSDVTICVNDIDPGISLEALINDKEYLSHFAFSSVKNMEMVDLMRDRMKFDAIVSMGHAIYSYRYIQSAPNFDGAFECEYLKTLLEKCRSLLEPDGVLLFDIQPGSLEWQKLLLSLSWLRGGATTARVALPPEDTLRRFLSEMLLEGFEATAHSIEVRKCYGEERREETAGFYIEVHS